MHEEAAVILLFVDEWCLRPAASQNFLDSELQPDNL